LGGKAKKFPNLSVKKKRKDHSKRKGDFPEKGKAI